MSGSRRSGNQSFSSLHLGSIFKRRQNRGDWAEKSGASGSGVGTGTGGSNSGSGRKRSSNTAANMSAAQSSSLSPRPDTFASPPASTMATTSPMNTFNLRDSPASTGQSKVRRRGSHFSILSPGSLFDRTEVAQDMHPSLTEVFVNEEDVAAFAEALRDDAGQQDPIAAHSSVPVLHALSKLSRNTETASQERSDLSPQNGHQQSRDSDQVENPALQKQTSDPALDPDTTLTRTRPSNPRKVGRIAAASDFAPIRERTQRRSHSKIDTGSREGFLYMVLRFPLLLAIFLTIALEFTAYVLIRQIVNVIEYLIAWRGKKGMLRSRLRKAKNAMEWRNVALELDEFLGYEGWKREDASGLYDWILVKKVTNSLQTMREKDDADGLIGVLELCLRNNFAGTENFRLYSETFFGTKYLIENYLSEVEEALAYIQETKKISPQSKRSFYRGVQRHMGRSALCLSGGGSFGYYHIGLVKALLDANLLPAIISGTSAGGLIAALACTRTNEELRPLLVPELADRITACEEPFHIWGPRAYRTGARFDTVKWAEKAMFFTRGSMTFAEAHARTGKVLNISVIPSDRHSPVKLLNYQTAPNCIIWSSLLASAAVPGIMNPVCLMQKDKRTGQAVPWNWGHRFKDGSLRVDIPLQDLHSLFNVNYPIVSQVNPHVHLFFFAPKGMPGRPVAHRKGKGWRGGFILSASEHVLKLHLSMNFKIIRDLDLLPSILGQDWSTVFLQQFGGAVTIWPKTRAWDWVRILSDPDRKELDRMIRVGQEVTFPKLHMIENRVRLEKAIESGRKSARQAARAQQDAVKQGADVSATASDRAHPSQADGIFRGHTSAAAMENSLSATSGGGGGGLATASDTDGNDDFFSSKMSAAATSNTAAIDVNGTHPQKLRTHLRRLQGLRGMSSLHDNGGGDDLMSYATTPDEGAGGTMTPVTPGELPRHIRARSMGLDEEQEEEENGEADLTLPHGRTRTPKNKNASHPQKAGKGSNSNRWNSRGSMSFRWLGDRGKMEQDGNSSSSSSEDEAEQDV